jgi:hypothetical protein
MGNKGESGSVCKNLLPSSNFLPCARRIQEAALTQAPLLEHPEKSLYFECFQAFSIDV